jgi:hypothetical protein
MAVYLGVGGSVELERAAGTQLLTATISAADVNVANKRLSFNADINGDGISDTASLLATGDRLTFRALTAGQTLDFVDASGWIDNTVQAQGTWYVNVDQVGSIRLYDTFSKAITGGATAAITLTAPAADRAVSVQVSPDDYRTLGQVRSWELTTSREQVDTTALGEYFRQSYSDGIISGQGTLTCIWDAQIGTNNTGNFEELSNYLGQLVLRLSQGSDFRARFILKAEGASQAAGKATQSAIWYEALCTVTNVGVAFNPTDVVESRIEFVTNGPVRLIIGNIPDEILLEDGENLIAEDGDNIDLELGD